MQAQREWLLDAQRSDLASDEAMAILADDAADGQPTAILHHALLTLVRLDQADRAYAALTDPTLLQAELDAARRAADATCLTAYATIGVVTSADDAVAAQAFFHLALGHALTDNAAVNPEIVMSARERAPDQVAVWLGHISTLLGARPDRQAALIALSQMLLTPPSTA